MKRNFLFSLSLVLLMGGMWGCGEGTETQKDDHSALQAEVDSFINQYATEYQKLYYASSEAEWASNTHIVEGDTTQAAITRAANEAFAAYTGSTANIEATRKYLESREHLLPLQVRQLDLILYNAANNPEIVADLVKERIKAENEQNDKLFVFDYQLNGKSVTTNDLDEQLRTETNIAKRQKVWEASKMVGTTLKDGLANLRDLRNQTVQALGYKDYFTYQVSDYGMTREEMMAQMRQLCAEVWPLYRELHTWARYELAKKYKVEQVPQMLPAHWLPNRWGQDWSSMVEVEGVDLDGVLKDKGAEWLVKQAERFYVSLGFEELPASFYEKSSLYPLAADAAYKKNNHASAWHMDLDHDVRSLMSVEPNTEWYETTHHELGHIYYYLTYTNPDVPLLLRGGANRGYHEAMGSLLGLAAMQKPFLSGLELVDGNAETNETQALLKEALNYIVFIPFSAGVMTEFEDALYAENLPKDQFNAKWWELKEKCQGMVAPTQRGEEFCDAASKTHINNDAAQYYDYAVSYVLLFQFHDHIAKKILKQDPRATNYFGKKDLGKFLHDVMYPGASRDWEELLVEMTGEKMSARAMLEYFQPLTDYLKKQNEGREHALPEKYAF